MSDRHVAKHEDYVEPELLDPGGGPAPGGRDFHAPPPARLGLLTRLKFLAAGLLAFTAFGLFALGALLTSTVIGAVVGIPLILAGAALFFLLFKLLALGAGRSFTIRRF